MPKPRKYKDLYGAQKAYLKTDKGKEALKRRNAKARATKREWKRKHDGTIVDKQQWFIDNYGDIEAALAFLDREERLTIELYYGLTGDKPFTQAAIAEKLDVSQSTISRIKKEALKKLLPLQQESETTDEKKV